jgi:23S rRNA (guanosine2251-2'-O)-methyltransferase
MTRQRDGHRQGGHKERGNDSGQLWLWGTHAVAAALNNPARKCRKLLASQGVDQAVLAQAQRRKVPVETADPATISRVVPREAVHQGLALQVLPLEEQDIMSVLETCRRPCCLVLLDQVTDPHNFGAVIRSAAAFGASAVIVQDRHSPPLNGVLAKAASGALETVPVIPVVNIARTLEQLGRDGFLRLAFADEASETLETLDLQRDVVLVLGSEGEGLRRLTRENCDVSVRLPTTRAMPSLNVSNAAAVALYACAIARNRRQGGG